MKLRIVAALLVLLVFSSCGTSKTIVQQAPAKVLVEQLSAITNKAPYDPRPGMEKLTRENEAATKDDKLNAPIHFLVFGDSKGSDRLPDVLRRADLLNPQFCLTTADLVNRGAGGIGEKLYKDLDVDAGWFFRKYPTWPTLGNHEVSGPKENSGQDNYVSGVANFGDFFGLKDPLYSFTYGNAKFIALDWIKASKSKERLAWLEKELKEAQGKLIFVFKHRPYYTVGSKSYGDVEGKNTVVTDLFEKYKVTAVFSGHDHIYYRTLRGGVNYIISAGAGANVYKLKRAGDALASDSYYGRTVENENEFVFHSSEGEDIQFDQPMYYVLSVKVHNRNVIFEMIDTEGKSWDKFEFEAKN